MTGRKLLAGLAVRRTGVMLAALTALFAAPAAARDYYYFNKPGVDRQTYLEDRLACDELAGGTLRQSPDTSAMNQQIWQNHNLTAGQSAAASGIASLFITLVAGAEQRRMTWQVERICLADKGYRRFEIDKTAWKAIDETEDQAGRIDQWFALASTDSPQGKEMFE